MSVGVVTPNMAAATSELLASSPFKPRDAIPASPSGRSTQASHDRLADLRRSTTRSLSKLPSLSDIAARLNIDKDLIGEDGVPLSPSKSSSSEGRPRLDLTGRLIPTTSASKDVLSPTTTTTTTTSPALRPLSPSKSNTAAPAQQASGSQLASSSSSPTKRISVSGLLSLDEIRERMAKKGLTAEANTSTTDKENTSALSIASPSFALLKFGAGPLETEQQKKRRCSPPPNIIIPAKDASLPSKPSPAIRDDSIMRLGSSTVHPGKPISPTRTPTGSEPAKAERTIIRPGTGSLPPTPSSAVSNFAMSVTTPQPKTHPLQHLWTLYFDSKTFNPSAPVTTPKSATFPPTAEEGHGGAGDPPATPTVSGASWEASLKCLGAFRTVEAFFGTFKTLRRPSQLDKTSNYHIFKDGIKPMWEDPCNAEGGKWTLTLKQCSPALTDRSWMWLVLGLVGEELDELDEVTGAVCSLRPRGDRIALWLRSKSNVDRVNQIGRRVLQLLELDKEPGVTLEFSNNTGAPLEGPSRFINVQNPVVPGGPGGGQPSLLGNQRRQSFQGSISTMGGLGSPVFQQPLCSPQSLPNGSLQRSPERRGNHPVPRNPSPSSLASSLGVQLGSSPGKQSPDALQHHNQQPQPLHGRDAAAASATASSHSSRFGPLSATSGGALGRASLARTGSGLNPNLPMKMAT